MYIRTVFIHINGNGRSSEASNVQMAEKQKSDSNECREVAVIPQQNLQNK